MNPIYTDGFLELESLASEILGHSLPLPISKVEMHVKCSGFKRTSRLSCQVGFPPPPFNLIIFLQNWMKSRVDQLAFPLGWEGKVDGQLICLPNVFFQQQINWGFSPSSPRGTIHLVTKFDVEVVLCTAFWKFHRSCLAANSSFSDCLLWLIVLLAVWLS